MKPNHSRILSDFIILAAAVSLVVATCGAVSARDGEDDTTATPTPAATATTETSPSGSNSTTLTTTSNEGPGSVRRTKMLEELQKARQERDVKITEAKEAFKAKLALIKDAQKQETAQHLSDEINKINDNRTDAYIRRIDGMQDILDRLEERLKTAQTNGKDVTALLTKVSQERTKLDTLRDSVKTQQAKAYTVTIGSEKTLGQDFKKVLAQLKTDLNTLKNQLQTERKNTTAIFTSLKALKGEGDDATTTTTSPTPSASPTANVTN